MCVLIAFSYTDPDQLNFVFQKNIYNTHPINMYNL